MSPPSAPKAGVFRRFPWKPLAAVGLLLSLGVLAYLTMENQQTEGLRRTLLAKQDALIQQGGTPFTALRQKVGELVRLESASYAGDLHLAGFDPRSFKDQVGIYLRLPVKAAAAAGSIEQQAQHQPKDALAGCLGLAPVRYGKVLKEGWILSPEYRQGITDAPNRTRIQVLAEDFRVRVERDLQPLATHLRPAYLLLVLEEEPQADKQLYRIAFYDLQGEKPTLQARARTESAYRLLPVRWLPKADRRPKEAEDDLQSKNTAADCAIAAALRPVESQEGAEPSGDPGTAAETGVPPAGEKPGEDVPRSTPSPAEVR